MYIQMYDYVYIYMWLCVWWHLMIFARMCIYIYMDLSMYMYLCVRDDISWYLYLLYIHTYTRGGVVDVSTWSRFEVSNPCMLCQSNVVVSIQILRLSHSHPWFGVMFNVYMEYSWSETFGAWPKELQSLWRILAEMQLQFGIWRHRRLSSNCWRPFKSD